MPSRDYFLKGRNNTMLLAYEKMVKEIAVALGADPAVAEQDAKELVDFEIELANVSVDITKTCPCNIQRIFSEKKR